MKLKELRKNINKTQEEVSKEININRINYNRYELNQVEPNISTLKKLADYFGVSIDYLLDHEVPYLINKSKFSAKQLSLIDVIEKLDNTECDKVLSYIDGLKDSK